MTPQQLAQILQPQPQPLVQPVGDVIPGPKRWFTGETPNAPLLGPMAGGGGAVTEAPRAPMSDAEITSRIWPNVESSRVPSASDSAQTDFDPAAKAIFGANADPRMSLMEKQIAEANTLNQLRAGNIADKLKWSEFGRAAGMDPNVAAKAADDIRVVFMQEHGRDATDNEVKYLMTLARQKGLLP